MVMMMKKVQSEKQYKIKRLKKDTETNLKTIRY
jgi:hypothetical protein